MSGWPFWADLTTISAHGCYETDRWLTRQGWGKGGGGLARVRVEAGWAAEGRGGGRLAWVRCRYEFYLLLFWVSLPLSVFSLYSFFLPFLSYAIQLVLRFPCISVRFA